MRITLIPLLCFLPLLAEAVDAKYSAMLSVVASKPHIDGLDETDGVDEKYGATLGIGMRALLKVHDTFNLRTGIGIRQKDLDYDVDGPAGNGEVQGTLTYFSIPVGLHVPATEQVGFFLGTSADLLIDDDCETTGNLDKCTMKDEASVVFPLVVGVEISPTDLIGFELSYEHAAQDSAADTKVHSYVGSFLYHF